MHPYILRTIKICVIAYLLSELISAYIDNLPFEDLGIYIFGTLFSFGVNLINHLHHLLIFTALMMIVVWLIARTDWPSTRRIGVSIGLAVVVEIIIVAVNIYLIELPVNFVLTLAIIHLLLFVLLFVRAKIWEKEV